MTEHPSIHRTSRGGIPIVWSPYAGGDHILGIVIRAGRADERLDITGVAHLVEHLILPAETSDLQRTGGYVDNTLTTVWYSARDPSDCLAFARDVARRSHELPRSRFQTEKRILRAEGESGQHPINYALALRFGARGYGLAGFPQLGLRWLELDEVQDWARRYLNRANIAVWMTWEPPAELEIDFPDGERVPAPRLDPIDYLSFPALAAGPDDFLLLQFLRERTTASQVALDLLQERLLTALRFEQGIGYQVGSNEETDAGSTAISSVYSDPRTAHASLAIEATLRVLDELADKGATASELEETARRSEAALSNPAALSSRLNRHAIAEFDPARELDEREWLEEVRELESDAVAAAIRSMLPTTLMVAPATAGPVPGFAALPLTSPIRVGGKRFAWNLSLAKRKRKEGAFLSGSRLTVVYRDNSHVTIDLEHAPLLLQLDKERRAVWDADGSNVEIKEGSFLNGGELIAAIDRVVSAERTRIDREHVAQRDAIERALAWYPSRRGLFFWLAVCVLATISGIVTHGLGLTLLPFAALLFTALNYKRQPSRARLAAIVTENLPAEEEILYVFRAKLVDKVATPGVLIATERRLIFYSARLGRVETRFSEITSVKQWPFFSTISLRVGPRRFRFEYVTPRRQRRAIVQKLRSHPNPASYPPRWTADAFSTTSEGEDSPVGLGLEP